MKNLSEHIDRKFIDQQAVDEYEILTDNGWKDIACIGKTIPYQVYELKTKTHQLKCADTHIVFDACMNQIFVKDLQQGDMIQTDVGCECVEAITVSGEEDNMYDIQINDETHRYFTDGILSHNSTIYCIYALWLTTFFPEKKVMILANKLATALELLGRIQCGYQYLPKFLKSGCTTFNKSELSFSNMSSIRAFASSSDAARGFSCNCIICDEFAFLQRNIADKLFTSMYPTISSSKEGKFIIVSTPNGTDNLYYDIWQQANAKDQSKNLDGWKPFEMYWWQVPGHDEEWKKKQIAAIGARRFAQEFNNEFLTSSGALKLIEGDIIDKFKAQLSKFKSQNFLPKKQKIVSQDEKQLFEFDMWHEFEPQKTYAASMDIAEGVGQDASVLYIWDVTDLEDIKMCARYSDNHTSVVQFAYIARKMLALYNDPPLAGERNGVSAGTMDSLRITYGYDNIVRENKKNEAGIYSHVTVKEKACQWTKTMTSTRGMGFTIYDKELVDEMGIFCKKDTKGKHILYEALPGPNSHDDHMMAFVWLTYILNPEIIDKYFIVCQTYADDFGNIYPKILQPMNAYTSESWKKIKDDPLYKDFLEFKEESKKHCKMLYDAEKNENANDMFQFTGIRNHDDYFGDEDGTSWDQDPRANGNWQIYDQAKLLKEQEMLKRRINSIPAYFI